MKKVLLFFFLYGIIYKVIERNLKYGEIPPPSQRWRSGHNVCCAATTDDSKGSRAHHLVSRESSRFLAISLKCFIFLEFWMNAFQLRPCKSRAKFKHNQIRRDIEVVITGLTRNQFALTRTRVRIPLSPPNRPQFQRIAVFLL